MKFVGPLFSRDQLSEGSCFRLIAKVIGAIEQAHFVIEHIETFCRDQLFKSDHLFIFGAKCLYFLIG